MDHPEPADSPSRRAFLKTVGIAAFAGIATGASLKQFPFGPGETFDFGLSSGLSHEPWNSVLIKARVAPPNEPFAVAKWYVYRDPDGREPLDHPSATGTVSATYLNDFHVAAIIEGLDPATPYYFRWEHLRDGKAVASSAIARTKTAPSPWELSTPLRIAVVSCQNYSHGYFHAFDSIADDESIDVVAHLGDYVYSDVDDRLASMILGYPRTDLTPVAKDLDGYRAKYRMYRSDPMLKRAHATHPFIMMWDDHEIWNDYLESEGRPPRFHDARRAWFEAMPVATFAKDPTRIHRKIPWGRDLQLVLPDSRSWRTPQDPWGDLQRAWIGQRNERETVLLNSTFVAPELELGSLLDNAVVISGDKHIQGANQERYGMQVMCGAVSSRSGGVGDLASRIEHLRPNERGYVVLDIEAGVGVRTTFMSGNVERLHSSMQPGLVLESDWGNWSLHRPSDRNPSHEVSREPDREESRGLGD